MNHLDGNRSRSPSGYCFRLNPQFKARKTLLSPEGYLPIFKEIANNKSHCVEYLPTAN